MIDLQALRKAALGDPTKKVSVNKAWLREVYLQLKELERYREKEAEQKDLDDKMQTLESDLDSGSKMIDEGFKKIFRGKGLSGLFGK